MFQLLSSLLFGGSEEASTDSKELKPRVLEADEEGWLLVSLPDGATLEGGPVEELLTQCPEGSLHNSALEDSVASLLSSVRMPEAPPSGGQSGTRRRTTRGAAPRPGGLTKVTQVGRVQRAQARANWGSLGRTRLCRHNCVRQRVPWHASRTRGTSLQQPCPRSFSH